MVQADTVSIGRRLSGLGQMVRGQNGVEALDHPNGEELAMTRNHEPLPVQCRQPDRGWKVIEVPALEHGRLEYLCKIQGWRSTRVTAFEARKPSPDDEREAPACR